MSYRSLTTVPNVPFMRCFSTHSDFWSITWQPTVQYRIVDNHGRRQGEAGVAHQIGAAVEYNVLHANLDYGNILQTEIYITVLGI